MRNFKTEGSLTSLSGSGMRDRPYATRLVAAYNSIAIGAENADYVCTGVDDHILIQQAIDACELTGGRVELLEGDYFLDSDYVSIPSLVSVTGQGVGTRLNFSSFGGNGVEVVGGRLADLRFVVEDMNVEVSFYCWAGCGVIDNITYENSGFEG